jgi:hypothetical protein
MGFKYHGTEPFLKSVDDALANYDQEARGHAVTVIQRNRMNSLIGMIGALISSPKAMEEPVKKKTNELLQDLLDIAPSGIRTGKQRIDNISDIRPRMPYWALRRVGLQYHLEDPVTGNLAVANGPFVFAVVTSRPWEVRVGTRADGGHTAITRGASVYFAGQTEINAGAMAYWDNDSGHYQPLTALHGQVVELLPQNLYRRAV